MKPLTGAVNRLAVWMSRRFRVRPPSYTIKQTEALRAKAARLSLYQLQTCPFCIRVRWAARRNGLRISLCNVTRSVHRDRLLTEGGRLQVPCLRIEKDDGTADWLYESKDIVDYLDRLTRLTVESAGSEKTLP